jgi:tetratricopeptide (TPR) repeat protein
VILRKSFRCAVLACVIFLAPGTAAFAEDPWQLGKQAFERAEYSAALEYFESAREAGQAGPAVHYNIGVCQYKLARYPDSRETFSFIARQFPGMRGLAEYNLGLVERKLGDTRAAQQHFLAASELSDDDETLRTLSTNMLLRTDTGLEPSAYWVGSFGFRVGYDDNVALRDDLGLPVGTTTDSPMADAYVSLLGPFREDGHLHLDAAVYVLTYFDIHDFDQNALSLGAIYDWNMGGWRAEAGLYAGYGTLGGDGFDNTASGSIRISRYLSPESHFSIRYRYDEVGAESAIFSVIEGSRQRLDGRYRWSRQRRHLSLRYIYETNDRLDPSVSPDRHDVRIDFRYDPESGLGYEVGGQLRSSEHDRLAAGRSEDLFLAYVGIKKNFWSNWQIQGRFQYSENDSSDPQFSYERTVITIGILKNF